MPKSRRDKVISLTQTKKKDREWKGGLIEQIREALETYQSVFVFRCTNLRNNAFKELKAELSETSRFFMGSNKVIQVALGKGPEDEQRDGLHQLSEHVRGHAGVVFTDLTKADLDAAMAKYEVSDYARTGTVATDTIMIESGPVHGPHGGLMEHTMEPTLRKNGMPTKLNRGVIELLADHTLCREGDHVSPQGAILLRLFGHELATFKLDLLCGWHEGGEFEVYEAAEDFDDDSDSDGADDRFKNDHVPSSMMLPAELMHVESGEAVAKLARGKDEGSQGARGAARKAKKPAAKKKK